MAENKNSRARIEANNRNNAKAYDRINAKSAASSGVRWAERMCASKVISWASSAT